MARPGGEEFRIDIDVEHAQREAERVRDMLAALRRRHDLSRYEYTTVVRIMPGGDTFAHPVLTLHEQMHWYLWYLGTPDRDMMAPFYDELVRRYPDAPIELPDGARNYDATYSHLVVNWLEIAVTSEFIGRERAVAVARGTRSSRWISRTVLKDWDLLGELYERYDIVPIRTAETLRRENAEAERAAVSGGRRKSRAATPRNASPRSRRRPRGRGGRTPG